MREHRNLTVRECIVLYVKTLKDQQWDDYEAMVERLQKETDGLVEQVEEKMAKKEWSSAIHYSITSKRGNIGACFLLKMAKWRERPSFYFSHHSRASSKNLPQLFWSVLWRYILWWLGLLIIIICRLMKNYVAILIRWLEFLHVWLHITLTPTHLLVCCFDVTPQRGDWGAWQWWYSSGKGWGSLWSGLKCYDHIDERTLQYFCIIIPSFIKIFVLPASSTSPQNFPKSQSLHFHFPLIKKIVVDLIGLLLKTLIENDERGKRNNLQQLARVHPPLDREDHQPEPGAQALWFPEVPGADRHHQSTGTSALYHRSSTNSPPPTRTSSTSWTWYCWPREETGSIWEGCRTTTRRWTGLCLWSGRASSSHASPSFMESPTDLYAHCCFSNASASLSLLCSSALSSLNAIIFY